MSCYEDNQLQYFILIYSREA